MVFVTGGLYSYKQKYITEELKMSPEDFERDGVRDVQELVREEMSLEAMEKLADELSKKKVVIATEVGGGIIPLDEKERIFREQAGRLSCMLAERAERVVRVVCGLGTDLKPL